MSGKPWRLWVGPEERYDLVAACQFSLMVQLGLREHHSLLDIGCGSLRGGRLFLMYLLPDRYCGTEPHREILEQGIRNEVGMDVLKLKRPSFDYSPDFKLNAFGRSFDFIIAQSIFTHASKKQISACLGAALKVMAPGAVFVATYMKGKDRESDLARYPELAYYTSGTIAQLAAASGLRARDIPYWHPGGHTWVELRKA